MAMLRRMVDKLLVVAAFVFVAAFAAPAIPAQKPTPIQTYKKWTAFTVNEGGGKACFIAAQPENSEPKNIRRGEVWLLVTHRPYKKIRNEISVYAGYPYKKGSNVRLEVDRKKKYELFTDNDTAWASTGEEENAIVRAMRAGNSLRVRGTSKRGTKTVDRYSLSGFTAAHRAIDKACKRR